MVQRQTRVLPFHTERAAIDQNFSRCRHQRWGKSAITCKECNLTDFCSLVLSLSLSLSPPNQPRQTTLSNATQVVISQVDTNISGKFSCEGNVMFITTSGSPTLWLHELLSTLMLQFIWFNLSVLFNIVYDPQGKFTEPWNILIFFYTFQYPLMPPISTRCWYLVICRLSVS